MRKSRKSAADEPAQKGERVLPHFGPGVRQAIEGDEVYFVEARADDTEVRKRHRAHDLVAGLRAGGYYDW